MIPEPMSSDIAEELEVSEMAILLIITQIASLSRSTYAETVLLSLKVIYTEYLQGGLGHKQVMVALSR